MMREDQAILAKRYARAFINVFGDRISYDDCVTFQRVSATLRSHHGWLPFFQAPDMTDERREQMVIMLQEQLRMPAICERLINLLIDHNRMALLPDVCDAIARIFFDDHHVAVFAITSFPELTAEQVEYVRTFLADQLDRRIMYSYQVNKRLIAGIRAQSSTVLWEYSLLKKLRDAHKCMQK